MNALIIAGVAVSVFSIAISSIVAYKSYVTPDNPSRLLHDAPLVMMYIVGVWIFIPLGIIWVVFYAAIAIITNLWYMVMICPHCIYYGKDDAVSVLCGASAYLSRKGDPNRFSKQFNRNVGAVIIGWIVPLIGSGYLLYHTFGDSTWFGYNLFFLISFCIIAFYLLPKASEAGCRRCEMADKCPWRKSSQTNKV